jgi:hypothetical protein
MGHIQQSFQFFVANNCDRKERQKYENVVSIGILLTNRHHHIIKQQTYTPELINGNEMLSFQG